MPVNFDAVTMTFTGAARLRALGKFLWVFLAFYGNLRWCGDAKLDFSSADFDDIYDDVVANHYFLICFSREYQQDRTPPLFRHCP